MREWTLKQNDAAGWFVDGPEMDQGEVLTVREVLPDCDCGCSMSAHDQYGCTLHRDCKRKGATVNV